MSVVDMTMGACVTDSLASAYAVYFDHRRRTDPDFRKALKRESRRQARAAKEEAEAIGAKQREAIKAAVAEAKEEGFPTGVEEKEAYFMNEVARGETLCQDSKTYALVQYDRWWLPSDAASFYQVPLPSTLLCVSTRRSRYIHSRGI